jgi:hypothetical protein
MSPKPEERAPWQRLGWLAETTAVVDGILDGIGRRRTGSAIQHRHSSVTGLLSYATDRGEVWLKAVPPIFAHEAAVIEGVRELAGNTVPHVLADTGEWWLSDGFVPAAGVPRGDFLTAHAELQIASAPFVSDFRSAGCAERSLAAMYRGITALASRRDLLGSSQRQSLRAVACALGENLLALDDVLPATLIHGDLNADNVGWGVDGWFFFDWTDACVGHPFVDLALSLCAETLAIRQARAAKYAAVWADAIGAAASEAAQAAWPVLGAAHHALTYESICDEIDGSGGDHSNSEDMLAWLHYWVQALIMAAHAMEYLTPAAHHNPASVSEVFP